MRKQTLYLDTSVISALFDERTPERQKLTKMFFDDVVPHYSAKISDVTLSELNQVPDAKRKADLMSIAGLSKD